MTHWKILAFEDLTNTQVYEMYQLRSEVFVLEQNCVYIDPDEADLRAYHICYHDPETAELAACARIIGDANIPGRVSFGRVAVRKKYRGVGLGCILVEKILHFITEKLQAAEVCISAQEYLLAFYQDFGFQAVGAPYVTEGIPHITMVARLLSRINANKPTKISN